MIRAACVSIAAFACLAAVPAAAQDQEEEKPPLILSVGAGAQILPSFQGGDDYQVGPMFTGFARREGAPIPFRTPDDGIGPALIGRGGSVEVGPLIQFQSARDEDDVGALVGDVDFTVEAGAFVNVNLSDNFRLRFEAQRGVNGHEAFVGAVAADFAFRPDNDTLFTIGPRLRLNDSDYANAYFGVTPAAAALSGLPVYDADGGIRAVGITAGLTKQISRQFGVFAYAGYDRLVGDAADSPIVQNFGSEDQFSAGIALFFSFSLGNAF